MRINLSDASKRFNRDWIFKKVNYSFLAGQRYAITGYNGSGKSTLLQFIAGSIALTEGKIEWLLETSSINAEDVFKHITIAAPYIELIEEFTGYEFLDFHQQFKPFFKDISIIAILKTIGLEKAARKQIKYYSSGMKQRIKLAQAIFSDVPLLLLDEPCTNLDIDGYKLYNQLIDTYTKNKTIIVSSNDTNEFLFCNNILNIMDYKK